MGNPLFAKKPLELCLEEMKGETLWDSTLSRTHKKLERLAEKAAREYGAGKTKEMGFDKL